MKLYPALSALAAFAFVSAGIQAQTVLTPNGHTGYGLVPNAWVQELGSAQLHYSSGIPGRTHSPGHSMVAGWGLTDSLELSGRLVWENTHCRTFLDDCPMDTGRDLAGSFKWSPRWARIESHGIRLAIGGVDVGGAANLSNAYYAVATMQRRWFDWSAGVANARAQNAPLRGTFADVTLKPLESVRLGIQSSDRQGFVHGGYTTRLSLFPDLQLSAGYVKRIGAAAPALSDPSRLQIPPQFYSLTVSTRLGDKRTDRTAASSAPKTRKLPSLAPDDLPSALAKQGFHRVQINHSANGTLTVAAENTAYRWNTVDALGVAVALTAAAHRAPQARMRVRIQSQGLNVVTFSGDTACIRRWIEDNDPCTAMVIRSGLADQTERDEDDTPPIHGARSLIAEGRLAEGISIPRPELVVLPLINSTIGTELGAFDYDIAYSLNLLVPLWKGAMFDINRIEPTHLKSNDFDKGYFRNSAFKSVGNRRMFHQLVSVPGFNTQIRLSAGRVYETWEGKQVEVQTQTHSGQDRATLVWGKFENPTYFRSNRREYAYMNWRHAWDSRHDQTTTLTLGEFWSGDRGLQLTHRYWFGDSNVALYFRESTYGPGTPRASFIGLGITVPLTMRRLDGFRYGGVRGGAQFSYAVETRVRNPSNDIGGGYGITPAMGEPMAQTFNRDRNGTEYLNTQLWRVRRAAIELMD